MTLDEAHELVKAHAKFPLVGLRVDGDHIFVTLRKILDDKPIDYPFAMDRNQLRGSNDPAALVADHIKIANEELDAATGPLPVWGP